MGGAQASFFEFNQDPWWRGLHAGVDEVGIGPLAGPVTAAAVILEQGFQIDGLTDSKAMSAGRREALATSIKQQARAWALGWADVEEIDHHNILRASHLAMQRAVAGLGARPDMVLVDGNKTPVLPMPAVAIIGGDARVPQISAASILAKVARDAKMAELAQVFPEYGLDKHKGYPTRAHIDALRRHGASPCHRRSFAPVRAVLGGAGGVAATAQAALRLTETMP